MSKEGKANDEPGAAAASATASAANPETTAATENPSSTTGTGKVLDLPATSSKMFFFQENWKRAQDSHKVADVKSILQSEWDVMSADEKNVYQQRLVAKKAEFTKMHGIQPHLYRQQMNTDKKHLLKIPFQKRTFITAFGTTTSSSGADALTSGSGGGGGNHGGSGSSSAPRALTLAEQFVLRKTQKETIRILEYIRTRFDLDLKQGCDTVRIDSRSVDPANEYVGGSRRARLLQMFQSFANSQKVVKFTVEQMQGKSEADVDVFVLRCMSSMEEASDTDVVMSQAVPSNVKPVKPLVMAPVTVAPASSSPASASASTSGSAERESKLASTLSEPVAKKPRMEESTSKSNGTKAKDDESDSDSDKADKNDKKPRGKKSQSDDE